MTQLALRKEYGVGEFDEEKVDLIKRMFCKGATDDELNLFIHTCQRTGLDPCMKQIYAVKRKTRDGEVMTIQTGIDGLRLIADRSGKYCPGKETTFVYDANKKLVSATSYIKKMTPDGVWHEVSATAFLSEYKPKYTNDFWDNKPHIMLAKCSETIALKKAFPAEMSSLQTKEVMDQAEVIDTPATPVVEDNKVVELAPKKVTQKQAEELALVLSECPEQYINTIHAFMKRHNIASYEDLTCEIYEKMLNRAINERQKFADELKVDEDSIFDKKGDPENDIL